MTNESPLLTLNNGVRMPAIGLGVFQSPPEQTATAVAAALAQGYRLIDTAAAYSNERQVGEGLRGSGIPREDVFLETKLQEIARQHRKSAAQVMLRWHLQEGRSAIPKSTQPARIAENFDLFDFELSSDQLAAIDALDNLPSDAPGAVTEARTDIIDPLRKGLRPFAGGRSLPPLAARCCAEPHRKGPFGKIEQ